MRKARITPDAAEILRGSAMRMGRETVTFRKPVLRQDALYGLTGKFIEHVMPHTEADIAAVTVQFLITAGIYLGRTGYYEVEGTRHYTNPFAVIVGVTSKGRKGTSWGQVLRLFRLVNTDFLGRIVSGISTGEGIIHAVRDEVWEEQAVKDRGRVIDSERVKVDAGVEDKRLLVQEPEFARVLKNTQRDTNNASAVIREAWDSGFLNILTKTKPTRASNAHIGIIGHITAEELHRHLTDTETANGFANRFLWIHSQRSKILPHGGSLEDSDLVEIAERLKKMRDVAGTIARMKFDQDASKRWEQVYGPLSDGKPGLLGAVLARAEAQVVRLATLYALLDGVSIIRLEHLMAALAIWEYSEASARILFGDATGDETADRVAEHLQTVGPNGATRTEISKLFNRNKPSDEIERALYLLAHKDRAHVIRSKPENGPPIETWFSGAQEEARQNEVDELDEMNRLTGT